MKKLAFLLATAIAALAGVNTASAQTVSWSGDYQVQNSASAEVEKSVVTFPGSSLLPVLSRIPAGLSAFLRLRGFSTSGTVFSNSFVYENEDRTKGCVFTTLGIYNRRLARYSYTFSATALNKTNGPAPTCDLQNKEVNPTTGVFSITAIISGF